MNTIAKEFIEQSIYRIEKNTPKIIKCLDQLTEEQIWLRPNDASNSVGNILLHLCGNIRQYAISALGDQPDIRERDKEFSTKSGDTKTELLNKLTTIVDEAKNIISTPIATALQIDLIRVGRLGSPNEKNVVTPVSTLINTKMRMLTL